MSKNNYWQDRFIEEEERLNKIAGDEFRRQQLEYERAIARMNKDIEVWYNRIAKNNDVSLAEAKKMLNDKELKEFKWTLDEYIKHGEENGIDKNWNKELENASARVHIERLEAMKLQVRGEIEKLYNGRESGFESYLKNLYKDQYNRTAFQIAKGTGVGTNIYSLNDKLVNTVIKKPWAPDGKNFSDRIWEDKDKLINTLHTEMTQAFIRGDSLEKLADKIAEKMKVSKANASRLVYTESAAYSSRARLKSYQDLGVEKYEIVATLDNRTSDICQDMDGKVFDLKDYEVGVTANPFHVRCRTTTAPYFDDMQGERAARNEKTGETEYVPANMKYSEWKEKYIDNNSEKVLQNDIKMSTMEPEIIDKILETVKSENSDARKEIAEELLKANGLNVPVNVEKINQRGSCEFEIDRDRNTIKLKTYNLQVDDDRDIRYQMKTMLHEMYHAKMDGLKTDVEKLGKANFLLIEETFTESTAHYLIKELGISDNLMPAYSGYLTETLPKLKMLKEFKDCKTIEDFGEIMFDYRLGNKKTAEWTEMYNTLDGLHFNKSEYAKKYFDFIENNLDVITDKIIENTPVWGNRKEEIKKTVRGWIKNGEIPSQGQEKKYVENILIAAMRLKGVE
jgi:SPP1 gp7 family putative phage head morphogenesis protein